ncbi:MAG: RNA polymerase factor sigma-54 [Verrucomicrobiota bacterium]
MVEQFLSQTQQQRLQMVLAPQLRQSLELLQVPMMELRTLVQQEIEQNPTIEETPIETTQVEVEPNAKPDEPQTDDNKELDFKEEFEVLARLDDEWREYFQQNQGVSSYTKDDAQKREFFLESLSQGVSLQEHLLNQLSLSELEDEDSQIGEMIIGSVNDDGYLTVSIEDLAENTGYHLDRLRTILDIIQEFDPIGVAARDLRECLMLQVKRLGMDDTIEADVVENHLDTLGHRKYQDIARSMKISLEDVKQIASFVATLEPKPGRMFTSETPAYVLPEVVVQKGLKGYHILLNDDELPRLRISKHYRTLMEDPKSGSDVKTYIREKVRAGAFLIKSINQRQQTITKIAEQIIDVQKAFLDHGVSHLKPLTMSQIAEAVGIHETTVSRAIANKYMQTPRGTFEMKFFFTPGFKTADGKQVSNKSIKDEIAAFIADENSAKPLSDQAIVGKLQEKGLKVARRTIAKYREELNILPSHLRKSI